MSDNPYQPPPIPEADEPQRPMFEPAGVAIVILHILLMVWNIDTTRVFDLLFYPASLFVVCWILNLLKLRGFAPLNRISLTLVELLVVLAILGILWGLLQDARSSRPHHRPQMPPPSLEPED